MSGEERTMRLGYLLSEIELDARRARTGEPIDIFTLLVRMQMNLIEAQEIVSEVSREALDEVVAESKSSCTVCGRELHLQGNPSMSMHYICPIHGTRGAPQ